MTPDQQRIAIAEACGWKNTYRGSKAGSVYGFKDGNHRFHSVPFYPSDLNAIHEARKALVTTTELRVKYLNALRAIVARRCPKNKTGASLVTDYDLVNAEAWEHAETLVKVTGKWVEA